MEATIYKSTGSWYLALNEAGEFKKCRLAGKLKLDDAISSSNPVAVGDMVKLLPEENQETAVITEILSRKNYMVRASPHQSVKRQILAANIDQAVLLVTLRSPTTSQGFLDRFLVTAAAYHIPASIIFNKTDLHKEKDWVQLDRIKTIYNEIGYPIYRMNALEDSMEELQPLLKDKTTLFAGHSGVGKSTMVNKLIPDKNLKTQEISTWSGKGLHTTTFAEMFDLPFGGRLIDTPGIREWGIIDIEDTELSHYFKEMQPLIGKCKFNDCLHLDEPGCVIKEAVVNEQIDFSRFESYLAILASIKEKP